MGRLFTKTNLANMPVDSPTALAPQSFQSNRLSHRLDRAGRSSGVSFAARGRLCMTHAFLTSVSRAEDFRRLDHIQRKKLKSMSRMITESGTPSSQRRIGMDFLLFDTLRLGGSRSRQVSP
jgi:hypothetical protein